MSSLPPPPDDLPEPAGEPVPGLDHPTGAITGSWPEPPVAPPSPFGAPPAVPAPPGGGPFAPIAGQYSAPPPQFPPPSGQYPAPPGQMPPPPTYPPAGPGPGLPAPPGGWIQPVYDAAPPPPTYPPGGYGGGYAGGYQAYRPGMRPNISYAGFWARLGGAFLDGLIIGLVPAIIYVVGFANSTSDLCTTTTTYGGYSTSCNANFFDAGIYLLVALVLYLVLLFFVVIRPIGTTGQSIGMKVVGVRAVDAATGRPIGIGRAFGRHAVTWLMSLCSIVSLLGHLWMLWDDRKQTLHDKAVSAIVIRA